MKRCTVSIFIIHVLYMNLAKKWCLSPNKHRFIDIRLFLLAWLLLIGWRRNVPYHKQTHILTTRLDEVSLSLSRFNSDKSSFTIRTISWHISKITRFHIEPFSRFIQDYCVPYASLTYIFLYPNDFLFVCLSEI